MHIGNHPSIQPTEFLLDKELRIIYTAEDVFHFMIPWSRLPVPEAVAEFCSQQKKRMQAKLELLVHSIMCTVSKRRNL